MALSTMYPAKNGSPKTTLSAAITRTATSMTLADASVLPAAPNLAVIGTTQDAEIVLYTSVSGNTVSGLTRGVNGTSAQDWSRDTIVGRNFTAFDHNTLEENILDLDNRKAEKSTATASVAGLMSAADKSKLDGIEAEANKYIHPDTYGYCTTAAGTAAKEVTVDGFTLETGVTIFVKFQYANTVSNPTLNVNGTGALPTYRYGTTRHSTDKDTDGWQAGAVVAFTYDGAGWSAHYWNTTTYNTDSAYCSTAAGTAAKSASLSGYVRRAGYFQLILQNANSYSGAITLNINSKGALPVYINGQASGADNKTLPAGVYIGYCDGEKYYLDTNGNLPNLAEAHGIVSEAPSDGKQYGRRNASWEETADVTARAALAGKADAGHIHDDRYYTESEVDTRIAAIPTYTLPPATQNQIGGVKPGANLTVQQDGTLDASVPTYSEATSSAAGLMPAADKAKVDAMGGIQVRPDYIVNTTDLTDGTSALETGKLYFYY